MGPFEKLTVKNSTTFLDWVATFVGLMNQVTFRFHFTMISIYFKLQSIPDRPLTLFNTGSGMTLSHEGGPLWPSLIFCYITQQKVALTPKTCSQIKFLIFRHPFTPLFQHSWESFPPFMSVNVDQHLDIETLKIRKAPPKFLSPIPLKFSVWNH